MNSYEDKKLEVLEYLKSKNIKEIPKNQLLVVSDYDIEIKTIDDRIIAISNKDNDMLSIGIIFGFCLSTIIYLLIHTLS